MTVRIDAGALVLVGDGAKVLFLRNKGDAVYPSLVVENVLELDNPPSHEQGTDSPGRLQTPANPRSATEPTDWHRLAEERFAVDIAEALYKAAHAGRFDKLVIVAPPRTMGELRQHLHKEVADRIVGEITKDLTSLPIHEVEKKLAAA